MFLRTLYWWVALATFLTIGVFRWSQFFAPHWPDPGNPEAGLDTIAFRHFGLEDGAAALRRELKEFPEDASLLVVGPGQDWTLTEAYHLISYLAWPRPVWSLGLVPPGEKTAFDFRPPPGLTPRGIFFYKTVPGDVPTRKLSERLAVGTVAP